MVALPIRWRGFAGMVPRLDARLLNPGNAQRAINMRLHSGALEPLREPKYIHNPTKSGTQRAIYLLVSGASQAWLTWDRDVDAAAGPIAQDTSGRTYFTGDGEPRVTDYTLATTGGTDFPMASYVLGIVAPTVAPSVSPSGGSGAAASRAYRYTFLSQWGEEGAPSPASAVTNGKIDDAWALSAMQTAPANSFAVSGAAWSSGVATLTVASTFGLRVGEEINVTGITPAGYNGTRLAITALTATEISYAVSSNPGAYSAGGTATRVAPHNTTGWKQRIYRTDSAGVYKLVVEQTAAATYNDTVLEANLGAELKTQFWEQPPTDMKGIVAGWNGMMFGFTKNQVCVSEPYQPHAWPSRYRVTLPSDAAIVAIGVVDQTLIVGTTGSPRRVAGSSPESLTEVATTLAWPCLAKRGLASGALGVFYPTREGLVRGTGSGFDLVTREIYSPETWKQLKPESFIADIALDQYHAAYNSEGMLTPTEGIVIIPLVEAMGVGYANVGITEAWTDPRSGRLYIVSENRVHEWDADDALKLVAEWVSPEVVLEKPANIGAAKLDVDFTQTAAEILALAAARDLAILANHIRRGSNYTRNVTATIGSAALDVADVSDLIAGMLVTGTGVPAGTTILSILGTTVTLSAAITSGPPASVTFAGAIYRSGNTSSGSAIVTGLARTDDLYRGLGVSGTGISAGTYIHSVDSNSQITLTANATASGTPGLTFTGREGLSCGPMAAAAYNHVPINGSCYLTMPDAAYESAQFNLYIRNPSVGLVFKFGKTISPPDKGFAMPSGYKTDAFYVSVAGNVRCRGVVVGENLKQLERA